LSKANTQHALEQLCVKLRRTDQIKPANEGRWVRCSARSPALGFNQICYFGPLWICVWHSCFSVYLL